MSLGRQAVIAVPANIHWHDLTDHARITLQREWTQTVTRAANKELGMPMRATIAFWFVTCTAVQIDDLPNLADCPNGDLLWDLQRGATGSEGLPGNPPGRARRRGPAQLRPGHSPAVEQLVALPVAKDGRTFRVLLPPNVDLDHKGANGQGFDPGWHGAPGDSHIGVVPQAGVR